MKALENRVLGFILVLALALGVYASSLFINIPSAHAQSVATLAVGASVQSTDRLRVRSQPSTASTRVGSEAAGASGVITAGPTMVANHTWWDIKWNDGLSGWSIADYLTAVSNSTPASGTGGSGTGTGVTSANSPVAIIVASQASVAGGSSVNLTWASLNTTSCSGTNFTPTSFAGTVSVVVNKTTTFSVTCSGPNGQTSSSYTVAVTGATLTAPTATLTATPTSISSGQSSTLNWSSTNATSCTGNGFTASGTSGTATVSPTATTNYSISCSGAGGSTSASASVAVSAVVNPAPTVTLSASPTSVVSGKSSTLTWSSTNATSCTGSGFTASGTSGSVAVTPSATTNYSISCTGAGGTSPAASAAVTVTAAVTTDTTAPSVPTNLAATAVSSSAINLTWTASTDNVAVTGYKIFRGGTQVGTSATNSYSDTSLTASTAYAYTVSAYDAAGNNSAQTSIVSATTQAATATTGSWWKPGPVALEWQWEIDHALSLTSAADMGTGITAYNGTVSPASDPQVYDIDGFDNTAATVASLHAMGKKVVCYIEVGGDDGRSDSAALKAIGDGNKEQGWPEYYINIANPAVVTIIKARIAMCAQKGFDAIEPDLDETYASNTGFPLTKAIEESYMTNLANYAHSLGIAMWGKNPDDTGDSYAADMSNTFDAVLTEECNQYGTCNLLSNYTGVKPVFNAEYTTATSSFCPTDNARVGWSGIKFPLDLNGPRTPCR